MSKSAKDHQPDPQWSSSSVFSMNDVDANGLLDLGELSVALTATLGRSVSTDMCVSFMAKHSTTGGGLRLDEFEALVEDVTGVLAKEDKSKARRESSILNLIAGKSAKQAKREKAKKEKDVEAVKASRASLLTKQADAIIANASIISQQGNVMQLQQSKHGSHDARQTDESWDEYPPLPVVPPVVSAGIQSCLKRVAELNFSDKGLWRSSPPDWGPAPHTLRWDGVLPTSGELAALSTNRDCRDIIASVASVLSSYAPLVPYEVCVPMIGCPRSVAGVRAALKGWDTKGRVGEEHRWELFQDFVKHLKWAADKEEGSFFKDELKTFFKQYNLGHEMPKLDSYLQQYRYKEDQMFVVMSAKHVVDNPYVAARRPSALMCAEVGRIVLRRNERPTTTSSSSSSSSVAAASSPPPRDTASIFLEFLLTTDLPSVFAPGAAPPLLTPALPSGSLGSGAASSAAASGIPRPPPIGPDDWTALRVFQLYDTDNSGTLDASELEFALTAMLGRLVSTDEASKLMKKFDADNSGELDMKEFERVAFAAKKNKTGLLGLISFKSSSAKQLEKAQVLSEREKLRKRELQLQQAMGSPAGKQSASPPPPGGSSSSSSSTSGGGPTEATNAVAHAANQLPHMPEVVTTNLRLLMKYVEEQGINEEGIYRKSCESKDKHTLEERVKTKLLKMDDAVNICDHDVHVAAGAIKATLRKYYPLIPYDLCVPFVKCNGVLEMKALFESHAPAWHAGDKSFLIHLLGHLSVVISHESTNRMSSYNIATVVGINLTRENETPPTDLMKEMEQTKALIKSCRTMFEQQTILFPATATATAPSTAVQSAAAAQQPVSMPKKVHLDDELNMKVIIDDADSTRENSAIDSGIPGDEFLDAGTTSMTTMPPLPTPRTPVKETTTLAHGEIKGAKDHESAADDEAFGPVSSSDGAGAENAKGGASQPQPLSNSDAKKTTDVKFADDLNSTMANMSVMNSTTDTALLSIKVSWKKGSSDEPLDENEIGEAFASFGTVVRASLKPKIEPKMAVVMFSTVEAVKKTMDEYQGPWKVKPVALSYAGSSAAADSASTNTVAATPSSAASEVMKPAVRAMEERSIKVIWKHLSADSVPTNAQLHNMFAAFGSIDKVIMKDTFAVVMFCEVQEAQKAASSFVGQYKVKLVKVTGGGSVAGGESMVDASVASKSGGLSLHLTTVSPRPKAQASEESVWLDVKPDETMETAVGGGKLQTTIEGSVMGGGSLPASAANSPSGKAAFSPGALKSVQGSSPLHSLHGDFGDGASYDVVHSAAEAMLKRHSLSGSTALPAIGDFQRVEAKHRELKLTSIIENLMTRIEATEHVENALQQATRTVDTLNAELAAVKKRLTIETDARQEEEHSWASESMVLKLQLNETERAERELRESLLDVKKENQQLQADLSSLERTAATIELVKQKALESARRDVGALLTIQENRLASQATELVTLAHTKNALVDENENLAEQHMKACEEMVAWRARAEAAELELRSVGRLAMTEEEKRSSEIARLLQFKVVGVDVDHIPALAAAAKKRSTTPPRTYGSSPSPSKTTNESMIRQKAAANVVTSQDIMNLAWQAQKELADRLDKDIAAARNLLNQSGPSGGGHNNMLTAGEIYNLTGYRPRSAWKTTAAGGPRD